MDVLDRIWALVLPEQGAARYGRPVLGLSGQALERVASPALGDGVRGLWANEWPGAVRPMLEWRVSTTEGSA